MELHLRAEDVEGFRRVAALGQDEDERREVARILVAVRQIEGRGLDEPARGGGFARCRGGRALSPSERDSCPSDEVVGGFLS